VSSNNTLFHNKHELLSEEIYNSSSMLPSRYVLVLTNKCNLNCSFCYQDKQSDEKNMKTSDWIHVLEQLPEYARVTLTGGEPLVYNDFKNIFSKIACKFDCNIISNGLLLSEEIIDIMLSFENFKVLSISIDDIGNKSRGVSEKQWKKLKNNLSYFIKKRDELKLNTILDIKTLILDDNSNELFDIYKYCREILQCDTYAFQFLKGSALQHADIMYEYEKIFEKPNTYVYRNLEDIKNELIKVQEYNTSKNKISYVHPNFLDLNTKSSLDIIDIINSPFHASNFKKCIFPWSSVHINYDGELFPCLSVSMGNVKDKSIENIMFGETYNKFKTELKEGLALACSRCGWLKLNEE